MGVQLRLLELMGSLEKNLKMLAAILLLCVALGSPAEAVQIDVIYESLCPDSTRFISQQIPPHVRGHRPARGDQVQTIRVCHDHRGGRLLPVRMSAWRERVLWEYCPGLHCALHLGPGHLGQPDHLHDELLRP